jgi:hypothetical protein
LHHRCHLHAGRDAGLAQQHFRFSLNSTSTGGVAEQFVVSGQGLVAGPRCLNDVALSRSLQDYNAAEYGDAAKRGGLI